MTCWVRMMFWIMQQHVLAVTRAGYYLRKSSLTSTTLLIRLPLSAFSGSMLIGNNRIYDICPSTIPSLLGADTYFSSLFTDTDWELCDIYLRAYDCTTELGYSSPARNVTNFYGPGDFPQNGTLDLFDTKGEGEIMTPASGGVFTWTANGVARTVTAVGVTGSVSGGASATAVETGSGTGTLAASIPSRTSAASMLEMGLWRMSVIFLILLAF